MMAPSQSSTTRGAILYSEKMEREIQSDVATESTGGHDDQSIIKPGKCLRQILFGTTFLEQFFLEQIF